MRAGHVEQDHRRARDARDPAQKAAQPPCPVDQGRGQFATVQKSLVGILSAADAVRAVEAGATGILVIPVEKLLP